MEDYWSTIRKKTIRAKESVLQSFGKADKTHDNDFAEVKNVFLDQQKNGYRFRDNLRTYLVSIRTASDALRNFYDSMNSMYEPQIGRADQLKYLTQDNETVWDQYLGRNEKLFQNVNSYCAPFPKIRSKIAKRNRKLVDYDIARHSFDSLQSSPKKTDDSVRKQIAKFEKAKETYESLNDELVNEIPALHEARLPFALENFQYFFDDAAKFHSETSKVEQEIADLICQDHEKFKANPPAARPVYVRKKASDYKSPINEGEVYRPLNSFQHSSNILNGHDDNYHDEGPPNAHHAKDLFKFQVTHKYIPTEADELALELGEVVEMVPHEYSLPNGWAHGLVESSGRKGVFPVNFTKRIN